MSSRRALTVPPLEIGGGVEPFAGTTTGQVGLRIEDVLQGLQQIGEVLCGVHLARLLVDPKNPVQHLSRTVHPLKVDRVLVRRVHQFEAARSPGASCPRWFALGSILSLVYASAKICRARVGAYSLSLVGLADGQFGSASPNRAIAIAALPSRPSCATIPDRRSHSYFTSVGIGKSPQWLACRADSMARSVGTYHALTLCFARLRLCAS